MDKLKTLVQWPLSNNIIPVNYGNIIADKLFFIFPLPLKMRAERERGRQVLAQFHPVKAVVFKRTLVSYFEITQYIEKPTFFFTSGDSFSTEEICSNRVWQSLSTQCCTFSDSSRSSRSVSDTLTTSSVQKKRLEV